MVTYLIFTQKRIIRTNTKQNKKGSWYILALQKKIKAEQFLVTRQFHPSHALFDYGEAKKLWHIKKAN